MSAAEDWTPDDGDLLEAAWILIANAGWDGMGKSPGWQEAAVRWRDRYHEVLARRRPEEPAPG